MTALVPLSVSSLEEARVGDVMSGGFLGCPFETPLAAVAEMMARHRVHCVVGFGDITEDDTRLWGLISDLDLVALAAAEGLEGRTAGGCAATEIVTVRPHESLRRAAQLMSEHGIAHVLVTDPSPTGRSASSPRSMSPACSRAGSRPRATGVRCASINSCRHP